MVKNVFKTGMMLLLVALLPGINLYAIPSSTAYTPDKDRQTIINMLDRSLNESDSLFVEIARDNVYSFSPMEDSAVKMANAFLMLHSYADSPEDYFDWATAADILFSHYCVKWSRTKEEAIADMKAIVEMVLENSPVTPHIKILVYFGVVLNKYKTIQETLRMIDNLSDPVLKLLVKEECVAWCNLVDARMNVVNNYDLVIPLAYQGSIVPTMITLFHSEIWVTRMEYTRRERAILLNEGVVYTGLHSKTTSSTWELFLKELNNSMNEMYDDEEDTEFVEKQKGVIKISIDKLNNAYIKWMEARAVISDAILQNKRESYDKLTSDIQWEVENAVKNPIADYLD